MGCGKSAPVVPTARATSANYCEDGSQEQTAGSTIIVYSKPQPQPQPQPQPSKHSWDSTDAIYAAQAGSYLYENTAVRNALQHGGQTLCPIMQEGAHIAGDALQHGGQTLSPVMSDLISNLAVVGGEIMHVGGEIIHQGAHLAEEAFHVAGPLLASGMHAVAADLLPLVGEVVSGIAGIV